MARFTLPITIVFLGVLVVALHSLALEKFLYFHFPWLDIVMHFLGGLLVSLFGLWAFKEYNKGFDNLSRALLLFDILLFTFIIGILWETFELAFGLIYADAYAYTIDTISDILMSTIGAMVGFFLVTTGHLLTSSKQKNLSR